uniref:ATP synthase complex subunit 8 n=1 Tax=Mylabris sp. MYL01 TaxID=1205567 RepID=A0A0S2MN66_9CUCU|nr:ATP synthase F0 subunit 8 [Mylabris sp. MYL01]
MPQMAPLNWLTLMMFFITIFIILNSFNFYNFSYQKKNSKTSLSSTLKINWKCL